VTQRCELLNDLPLCFHVLFDIFMIANVKRRLCSKIITKYCATE
jgi:hypothetical protein